MLFLAEHLSAVATPSNGTIPTAISRLKNLGRYSSAPVSVYEDHISYPQERIIVAETLHLAASDVLGTLPSEIGDLESLGMSRN